MDPIFINANNGQKKCVPGCANSPPRQKAASTRDHAIKDKVFGHLCTCKEDFDLSLFDCLSCQTAMKQITRTCVTLGKNSGVSINLCGHTWQTCPAVAVSGSKMNKKVTLAPLSSQFEGFLGQSCSAQGRVNILKLSNVWFGRLGGAGRGERISHLYFNGHAWPRGSGLLCLIALRVPRGHFKRKTVAFSRWAKSKHRSPSKIPISRRKAAL